MSDDVSLKDLLNQCVGRTVQDWRKELHLSLADMVDVLNDMSSEPIDVAMLADWESADEELPGHLFCFMELFHQCSLEKLGSVEPGAVMQQKDALMTLVSDEMTRALEEEIPEDDILEDDI